jgi:hypothetical protein
MNNSFLVLAVVSILFASCTPTELQPAASVIRPTETTSGGGGGGGATGSGGGTGSGKGGGTTQAPPSNLSIFTNQLLATWFAIAGSNDGDSNLSVQIDLKSNGSYSLVFTDNITGATTTGVGGSWTFTIPANIPINESGLLVLTGTKGGILLSGFCLFVHPGVLKYATTINNLPAPLNQRIFVMQKL